MKNKTRLISIPIVLICAFVAYQFFDKSSVEIVHITTTELENKLQVSDSTVYVDVREIDEFESGHIEGMLNVGITSWQGPIVK